MIEIRFLKKEDNFIDLILLSREFFNEYKEYHQDFFKITELKDDDITSYFASFCGQAKRKAFIALDGEQIVGYITVYIKKQEHYWQIKNVGEISGFMVQKEYRRKGIAKSLLEEAKKFFEAKSLKYYTVFTAIVNKGAIQFYRKNGLTSLITTMIGEI